MIRRFVYLFGREPMLLVTCAYVFISIVGIWDSYWFYRRFDVPILEYMQSSDYFVAGLRRPDFVAALAAVVLMSALSLWPDRWSMRNPERAEQLRQSRWWGKMLLPERYDRLGYGGMHPETATTVASVIAIVALLLLATHGRANRIERGGGHSVSVSLLGTSSPIEGNHRLLGTSSAFVFLWEADERRPEVIPVQSIRMIQAPEPAIGKLDAAGVADSTMTAEARNSELE